MAVSLDSPDLSLYAYSYAIWRKQIH